MLVRACLVTELLSAKLRSLGFAPGNQMRLYGRKFEFVSEPIVVARHLVLMDAIDAVSGKIERVRIPLPILKTAGMAAAA
jgi:hypothetical protein